MKNIVFGVKVPLAFRAALRNVLYKRSIILGRRLLMRDYIMNTMMRADKDLSAEYKRLSQQEKIHMKGGE